MMEQYDATIILGSFENYDMSLRAHKALEFLPISRIIILAGTRSEVCFMHSIMLNHNIVNNVITNDKSKTTIDNAYYSKIICSKLSARKIVVITSKYHAKRALAIFKTVFGSSYDIQLVAVNSQVSNWILKREAVFEKFIPLLGVFRKENSKALKNISDLLYTTLVGNSSNHSYLKTESIEKFVSNVNLSDKNNILFLKKLPRNHYNVNGERW